MPAHRRPSRPRRGLATRTPLLSAAASALMAVSALPAAAEPTAGAPAAVPDPAGGPDGPAAAEADVEKLRADAERAVEAYNATTERAAELEERLNRRQDQLARNQQQVNEQRRQLGSAAAAHYRSGGLDPSLALLLSQDPDGYLEQAATMARAASRQSEGLHALLAAERSLGQVRDEAADTLAELEDTRSALAARKREVRRKLAAAQQVLNQRAAAEDAAKGQPGDPGTPSASAQAADPGDGQPAASGRAGAAVSAARQALGRPYVWGQTGPSGFDCSGLTQWAYAQAGVALPRTSQAQANAGRRVSLDQAQPGDLVIYRADASHVALYTGAGQVIHAPYPGASVRSDPVGMMPVSAVVRP